MQSRLVVPRCDGRLACADVRLAPMTLQAAEACPSAATAQSHSRVVTDASLAPCMFVHSRRLYTPGKAPGQQPPVEASDCILVPSSTNYHPALGGVSGFRKSRSAAMVSCDTGSVICSTTFCSNRCAAGLRSAFSASNAVNAHWCKHTNPTSMMACSW